MNTFITPQWECNVIGDNRCKELLEAGKTSKKLIKQKLKKKKFKQKHKLNKEAQQSVKCKSNTTTKQDNASKVIGKKHNKPLKVHINEKVGETKEMTYNKLQTDNKQRLRIEKKNAWLRKKQTNLPLDNEKQLSVHKLRQINQSVNKRSFSDQQNKMSVIKLKKEPNNGRDFPRQSNFASDNSQQESVNKASSKLRKFRDKFIKMQKESINSNNITKKAKLGTLSLRQRMIEKLKASRFRYLNEQIYTNTGKEAQKLFKNDPDSFKAYHEGYRQQIARWPLNPLDIVIKSIKKLPQNNVVADFGCGDARLARSVSHKVHSFDLIASNKHVIASDMAHVPLGNDSVDVVVFCLSLMGTNLVEYIIEANRVLKIGGVLKIVEVESRFDSIEAFVEDVQKCGFTKTWKDLSHNLFCFLDFKKVSKCKQKSKLPRINLHPCLYKRR